MPDLPIKPLHKMTEAQIRLELEAIGLQWKETNAFLPQQHVVVFEKRETVRGGVSNRGGSDSRASSEQPVVEEEQRGEDADRERDRNR